MSKRQKTIMEIMGALIIQENGCCIWPGAKTGEGYGAVKYGDKQRPVHKLLYEHFVAVVPPGMELDHNCRNRACGNFAHVEPVTHQENTLRGSGPSALNAQKTHCPKGHAYEGDNLYVNPSGQRICRTCRDASVKPSVPCRCAWCGAELLRSVQSSRRYANFFCSSTHTNYYRHFRKKHGPDAPLPTPEGLGVNDHGQALTAAGAEVARQGL